MVKVTLGEQPAQNEKPFPKLMIASKSDHDPHRIVLFFGPRVGFCLKSTQKTSFIGEYCDRWNMEVFTDYNEPITIQNA